MQTDVRISLSLTVSMLEPAGVASEAKLGKATVESGLHLKLGLTPLNDHHAQSKTQLSSENSCQAADDWQITLSTTAVHQLMIPEQPVYPRLPGHA